MWYFIGNIRNVLLLLSTWEAGSDGGTLAGEQALQSTLAGGWEKEGELATSPLEFEYLHQKVDKKCWLAKMTLVTTSLSLVCVFQYLFTFALVSTSRWLAEIWQLSLRGATEELDVEFKFQRQTRSCKSSFLFPSRRQSAPESLLTGWWYSDLDCATTGS